MYNNSPSNKDGLVISGVLGDERLHLGGFEKKMTKLGDLGDFN